MSYRIAFTEPLPGELRRVIHEQLHRSAKRLRDPEYDRDTAIHDTRKAVKKSRSLLRLARAGLPRDAVRDLNGDLRDGAGLLSGARDAAVMQATLDGLAERYVGRAPELVFERARDALPAADGAAATGDGDATEVAAARLDAIADRVDALPWDAVDRDALVGGVVTAYRRGRDALAQERKATSVEGLHDWRKRVKDLWYHERLLEELWPEVLSAHAKESKRLSELLGDDHDLSVLGDALAAAGQDDLLPLVAERRGELQGEAFALGSRIYADRPKAFRRRLEQWWDAAPHGDGAVPA